MYNKLYLLKISFIEEIKDFSQLVNVLNLYSLYGRSISFTTG